MDPLSQGAVGALAGQSSSSANHLRLAAVLAFFSGMAADLDILIRSNHDPLLSLEYHRHFTHALIFVPLGGLLCASAFYAVFARKYMKFKFCYLFCTAGYATHALLDACTSYGTQLLWPFSSMRIAWNNISIIDPLFTLPLLLGIGLSWVYRSRKIAIGTATFGLLYLSLGVVQNQRALSAGEALAQSRGHTPHRIEAKASLGNLILWKVIYEYDDVFYVDAVRVTHTRKYYEGESIDKLNIQRDLPWLDPNSQQARDLERFRWFSADFLALDPDSANTVVDMRYSMLPNSIQALWGIRLQADAETHAHIERVNFHEERPRHRQNQFQDLWLMISGK